MEIHRAVSLGMLHRQLGINPDARISYEPIPGGVAVWDLETETEHTVNMDKVAKISSSRRALTPELQQVINGSDDDLKRRFSESWMAGWSEERETIFTELTFRGISTLDL